MATIQNKQDMLNTLTDVLVKNEHLMQFTELHNLECEISELQNEINDEMNSKEAQ